MSTLGQGGKKNKNTNPFCPRAITCRKNRTKNVEYSYLDPVRYSSNCLAYKSCDFIVKKSLDLDNSATLYAVFSLRGFFKTRSKILKLVLPTRPFHWSWCNYGESLDWVRAGRSDDEITNHDQITIRGQQQNSQFYVKLTILCQNIFKGSYKG